MNKIERKEFIKKMGLIAFVSAFLPEFLLASDEVENTTQKYQGFSGMEKISLVDNNNVTDFGIVDLHCHPSLKIYLLNRHLWKKHYPLHGGDNKIRMEVDTRQIDSGTIKGLITTHYLTEMGVESNSTILKNLFPIVKKILPGLAGTFEHEDMSNFSQINEIIDKLEIQVFRANQGNSKKIIIARSYKEFVNAIDAGNIPFAHAIEGAHALGRIRPNSPQKKEAYALLEEERKTKGKDASPGNASMLKRYKQTLKEKNLPTKAGEPRRILKTLKLHDDSIAADMIIRNLIALKGRGVCMITLAHFFHNDIIEHPVEGMSPDEKNKEGFHWKYDPSTDRRLNKIGIDVVNKMLEIGMIVDLTHSNPKAREHVFELNEKYNRPIIFSHSGARDVFNKMGEKLYPEFGLYDASEKEIRQIKSCGGVIGIIPEVFFLTGCDTHLPGCNHKDSAYGIKYILDTIDYIYSITGSYDHIAIGSDFDGYADEPKDLYVPSQFVNLVTAMQSKKDENGKRKIPDEEIQKITHGNALRVLKDGWIEMVETFKENPKFKK